MSQKSAIILLKWADIGHFLVWVLGINNVNFVSNTLEEIH